MIDDKNNVKKITTIVIGIIIILLLILIFSIYIKQTKDKRTRNKLKKIGYNEITNNTFNKKTNETSYNYNLKTKDFSKTINIKNGKEIKTIIISTKDKETINIYYKYQNNDLCKIIQKGTYKNKKFNCTIESKTNNCKAKCDEMYNEIKKFENNYNELVKNIK